MTPVAPRIVNEVSYVMIKQEYLVQASSIL